VAGLGVPEAVRGQRGDQFTQGVGGLGHGRLRVADRSNDAGRSMIA